MDRGAVTDFNTATKAGMYLIGDYGRKYPGNPGIEYGTLDVIAASDGVSTFVTQIATNIYEPNQMFRRTFADKTGNGVNWIEV